jgi:5-methylcytosine-specific restriction endonuclease McrA
MTRYTPGLSADQAHIALKNSVKTMDQARHCAVLWFGEIMERELYRELGFSTMRAYALEGLGFTPTRAGDFIRLAKNLARLPVLKEEVAAGKIGYTVAREIAPVADPSNEEAWVKVAKEHPRREVEVLVREARRLAAEQKKKNPAQGVMIPRPVPVAPAAVVPVRVSFDLTPAQYARYEAVLAKIGHRGKKSDLLLAMVDALLDTTENTPRGVTDDARPNTQIHLHECPSCRKSTVQTPLGEKELSRSEAAAAHCDAQIHEPGRRNTTTIPPRTRREVLARDRHQCRRKGCHHTRHLQIHHLIPRADSGSNEIENLVTLCTGCHELWHEKGGDLRAMLAAVPTDAPAACREPAPMLSFSRQQPEPAF